MPVAAQDGSEEGGAGGEDDLVRLDLVAILTGQRHVEEVFVLAKFAKGAADVGLEVVPTQAELLGRAHYVATLFLSHALIQKFTLF